MHSQPFRLAIVVVNYGSHDLLRQNLVPVSEHTPEALVVVVDNLTTPQERSALRLLAQQYRWVVVEPDSNLGFGAGANLGVAHSRSLGADAFLILNPDATIDAASLGLLLSALERDPLALVVPSGRRPDGRTWPTSHVLDLKRGSLRPQHPDADGGRRWRWVSGACLLLSDTLWSRIGGFDPDYFLYWEDVDLAFRAQMAGARFVVVAGAVAEHDEGGTQNRSSGDPSWSRSETYYYYNIRNRLLFAARNLPEDRARVWRRWSIPAAYYVLAIGGRRKFVRPWRPLRIAYHGIRDGRQFLKSGQS